MHAVSMNELSKVQWPIHPCDFTGTSLLLLEVNKWEVINLKANRCAYSYVIYMFQ